MPLLVLVLLAQPVPPRMPVDERPSAFACTFDLALSGANCTYEAGSGPGNVRDNGKLARRAGARACAEEAPKDEALRRSCEKAVAAASTGPACSVASRLADEHGRLTAEAQDCVEAVRFAVSRTTHPVLQAPVPAKVPAHSKALKI